MSPLPLLGGAALLVAAAFLVYLPALNGGFVMDDDLLVTESPLIRSWDGLYRIWFTTLPADYWPVTNTSFWIEWRLWGMSSTGYHVTNVALHVASALLVWAILRKLSIPGSWLAALLFAVHPVNVESVAWIAQRKNTLSMIFFLLAILWYLKADRGAARWYALSLLVFILAMLSKGSVAIVPFVLLLLAWWQRGTITKWDLARTAPFFLVAVVLAAVNVWFQTHGSNIEVRGAEFVERLLGAAAVVWFYLYKALVPLNLAFIYPQWETQADDWRWWLPLAAAVVVTAVLLWQRNPPLAEFGRPLLFAWLFFCVALVPVMGFTDVAFMKYSLVADHYQHIAIVGVVTLVAAGLNLWRTRAVEAARPAALIVIVLVVGALTVLAWQQSALYADPVRLYEDTLAKNPNCSIAHYNLGTVLAGRGEYQKAVGCFQTSVRLTPDDADAHNNLGAALFSVGRPQEAIEQYREALQLKPASAEVHYNLGNSLTEVGRLSEAIEHYEKSLELKPNKADARCNLGVALLNAGQPLKAIEHLQAAAQLNPNSFSTQHHLGHALKQAGRIADAAKHYQEAVRLRPEHVQALNNLGSALASSGRLQAAIVHFEAALRLKPDYAAAHYNLGNALKETGHSQEAIQHYKRALAIQSDNYEVYATLASTYADLNQSEEAIATAQMALDLARTRGEEKLIEQIQDWLTSYRSKLSQQNPGKAQPDAKAPPP